MDRGAFRNRTLLVGQCLILVGIQALAPEQWRYFSAFWPQGIEGSPHPVLTSLALIPAIVLVAGLFSAPHWFYLIAALAIGGIGNPIVVFAAIGFLSLLFLMAPLARERALLTAIWIGSLFAVLIWSNTAIFQRNPPPPLLWFSIMLHTTWGLKSLAWVVSVRSYRMNFTYKQFATYFFHPSFMMFTNDLSVLTPDRFLRADSEKRVSTWTDSLGLLGGGLVLLALYALCQNLYFKQLDSVGLFAHPIIGGVISIMTAIIFHWGNVCVQSAFLRAEGIHVPVDMNKPWEARTPSDYWRRMHYYVREYILDILVKPLMTYAIRSGLKVHVAKALLLLLLFAGFTYTQIGYQPFRANRETQIGLLITALFFMVTVLPEILPNTIRGHLFEGAPWKTRTVLWLALIGVYAAIFHLRVGF